MHKPNPFACRTEGGRKASLFIMSLALVVWAIWAAAASDGFTEVRPLGWAVLVGMPIAVVSVLAVTAPIVQRADKATRYVISSTVLWLFSVGSWGFIWDWQSELTVARYIGLFLLPPVGAVLALVLWRWSRAA